MKATKTLRDRIKWILETREMTQRDLARRAKLSDNHIATILSRLKNNPDADLGGKTLVALADAGGVALRWLATGDGSPEPQGEPPTHTNLEVTLARMEAEKRITSTTAAELSRIGNASPRDLPPEVWALLAMALETNRPPR